MINKVVNCWITFFFFSCVFHFCIEIDSLSKFRLSKSAFSHFLKIREILNCSIFYHKYYCFLLLITINYLLSFSTILTFINNL